MPKISTEPDFQEALDTCVAALRQIAVADVDESTQRRFLDLSENKEFLNEQQHEELMGMVEDWQQRTNERLKAQVVLKYLGELFPAMVHAK